MISKAITYLDLPPPGWYVLDVMLATARTRREWSALMIDVEPAEYVKGTCKAQSGWVRIPGRHRTRDAAWDALAAMCAATPAVSEAVQ